MKKVMLIAAVLVAFGTTACKKDYKCECTVLGETDSIAIGKLKKKDADKACEVYDTQAKVFGGSCSAKKA